MDSLTDNALMLQVKAGQLQQMGLLFERYHRPLHGFFYHLTGQAAASEDLVQTVFYRMLKYRHTFTGEGEFRTWMYHLARHAAGDAAKKNTPPGAPPKPVRRQQHRAAQLDYVHPVGEKGRLSSGVKFNALTINGYVDYLLQAGREAEFARLDSLSNTYRNSLFRRATPPISRR